MDVLPVSQAQPLTGHQELWEGVCVQLLEEESVLAWNRWVVAEWVYCEAPEGDGELRREDVSLASVWDSFIHSFVHL